MRFANILSIATVVLIIVSVIPSSALSLIGTHARPSMTTVQYPRIALIKLWEVTDHRVYMAKFVGEKYVVLFGLHGDVSLDGKYISCWDDAWVYDVVTGKLLGKLEGKGTWEVRSWDPFQAVKVWDCSGFFSADSRRMAEDPRACGGTNSKVLDTTSWEAVPIDWGFTDTTSDHFYAVQLDYSGSTLVVGHISDGTMYVYRYDPAQGKYVLVFRHQESGNYGRRLQMTLDGKYILIGGRDYPYLDIWMRDGSNYTRVVHYELPDTGGIGALGISDPYNVGYVIMGTSNGWVIIGKFDTSTNEFTVIYKDKLAPDNSWIYNPFYERWIPKVTEVFALCSHRDSGRPGYGIVYDVLTNSTITIHFADPGTYQWSAAAVSPEANYVFIGNTMYMVVKRDVLHGKPRVRFWGNLIYETGMRNLGTPITLKAPAKDWHLYFLSGRLTIHKIYTESVPVVLTDDPNILHGRLGNLLSKGMIHAVKVVESGGSVDSLDISPISDPQKNFDPEHTIAMTALFTIKALYGWNGHGFGGATVSSATVIDVPFKAPLDIYSEVTLNQSIIIALAAPVFDWKKELLGVFGLEFATGGSAIVARNLGKYAVALALKKYIERKGYLFLAQKATKLWLQAVGKGLPKLASRALGIVGIALMVDAGVGTYYHYVTYSSVRAFTMDMAVVEDPYGNKYGAIALILPKEEIDNYLSEYEEHIKSIAERYGLKDVGIVPIVWGRTWKDYKTLLAGGSLPSINLRNIIEVSIASKYGYNINELKIVGAKIIIEVLAHGKTNLWDYVMGGIKVPTALAMSGVSIIPKALTAGGKVYEDPTEIASLIGNVTINNREYKLVPGTGGAYVDFQTQFGDDKLIIDFGKRLGFFAEMSLGTTVIVEKEFEPLDNFGYMASFHYNWEDMLIRITKMEFVDMPYPMVKAERTFIYRYGNFTNDITDAFELSNKTVDPASPSGYRYYYVTIKNTKYIDPANGGTLMPCKKYVFRYFYREPPDVGIVVYLNGTKVTSTLAHHATVVVNSTETQDVTYRITFSVKYYEGLKVRILIQKIEEGTLHVVANGTAYRIYDITPYVISAINFMKSQGKPAFLEVYVKIIKAKYDYYKDNDEYRVVYYPPPKLPPPPPKGNYTVLVRVLGYDTTTSSWFPVAGATVEASYGTDPSSSKMRYSATTDTLGYASFTLPSGLWTFKASKEGYQPDIMTVFVYNDTIIYLYLSPTTKPPTTNRTYVGENATATFLVYDATDGEPIPNATIEAVMIAPTNSTYYGATFKNTTDSNGKAVLALPLGEYNITVSATGYETFKGTYVLDKDTLISVPLIPSAINVSEYARLEVRVRYADGKPFEGAHIEIWNTTGNTLIATLATNSLGHATLMLPKNQEYNVTVEIHDRLRNREYTDYRTVMLTEDTIISFTVPWNSTQPPTYIKNRPYYWLTIHVTWSNGLPFEGATVEVFNYTSGDMIDSLTTGGTGDAEFLLPAYMLYVIHVKAANPYNTSQTYTAYYLINMTDNLWITVRLPWMPSNETFAQRYRVWVYAYDATTGESISDVTVILQKGEHTWVGKTGTSGYAEIWVPWLGLYNVMGVHPMYQAVERDVMIFDNNTVINLPMTPVVINFNRTPPPPLNGSEYPPIFINGTAYWWLSVQVIWHDGYPFHHALVTAYNVSSGSILFQKYTNGTGFVHFLVPNGTYLKVTVNATNPDNPNLTYYGVRYINMTQHWYLVFMVPWESKYYSPEVWLKDVKFVIHRGQGYYFGNMSHLVLLTIWTNKPQNITVLLALYNESSKQWVENKTVTIALHEGVNVVFEWVSVNASVGGYFKVFVNITKWEYDTDVSNNWMWSNTVFLKPFVDMQVIILWRPVRQKVKVAILPGDLIEVDIGVKIPVNTTSIPAKLMWRVDEFNLKKMKYTKMEGMTLDVKATKPGIVWRNVTIVVPWVPRLVIIANVTHPWEDMGLNNFQNITVPIDPDVKVSLLSKPRFLMEGQIFKVTVNITSNVEPSKGIGWVSIVDNTTSTLLKRVKVVLKPSEKITIEAKAPENPPAFWVVKTPVTLHNIRVAYAGYDMYAGNNVQEFTCTVTSYQWLAVLAGVAGIIALAVAIRVATHTVHDVRESLRKFVKRKVPRFVKRKNQ